MDDVLIRRGNADTDTSTEGRPYANLERRWSSTNQGERPRTDSSLVALRRNPALISDFQHPELREK